MLKIVQTPNKVLSTPVKAVKKIDKRILTIIKEMKATLEAQDDPPGVGLSANQVGIPLAISLAKPTEKSKILVFINPKIIKKEPIKKNNKKEKKNKPVALEGCLSIKKIWGVVRRSPKVRLQYQDEKGQFHYKTFKGLMAIIIQHEVDHLNGILFTQRAAAQKNTLYQETDTGELEPLA